ncbi:MAG: YdcF family protein [Planctomycetes bacterium]|nr:YdcF family protein [Planctomycetota bacterium]
MQAGVPKRRRWWRRIAVGALVLTLVAGAMHEHVVRSAAHAIFTIDAVAPADCIVVPGARILPDGRPYHLLEDRLATAHELFVRGKAPCILLSGRGGAGIAEDEVASMRRWLASRGVPDAAMRDDPLGLRTIDTMRRCRTDFGMRSAIVVTNPFHVPRAVFLGEHLGLDVRGVEAPYGRDYSAGTMVRNRVREVCARIFAWCEVFLGGAAS